MMTEKDHWAMSYMLITIISAIGIFTSAGILKINNGINEIKYNDNLRNIGIVKVYYYTNIPNMTDSTSNITAFNKEVYDGCLAVSPDLLDYVQQGDCIFLIIDGRKTAFIVDDLMAKKNRRSVDIFMFCKNNKKITKKEQQKLNTHFYSRMWVKL